MTPSFRVPASSRPGLTAAALCALAVCGLSHVSAQTAETPVTSAQPELYRKVKVFDFDERPLGNFEDTPMYWRRLTGEGLPAYSDGRLDDQMGHLAPPSFLFTLRGGSIAYEYTHTDLAVSPDSDYLIECYVRSVGLEHARALLACYLVDQVGERIAASEQVSRLVGPRDPADGEWERLEIPLHVDCPDAYALRLQLWVLQAYVFEEPRQAVDPIIRQDVDARVWFDDLAIIRMPSAILRFSNPGGIVKPGAQEACQIDVHNATLAQLRAEFTLTDSADAECLQTDFDLEPRATETLRVPIPPLPAGLYRADVRLIHPTVGATASFQAGRASQEARKLPEPPAEALIHRSIRLAVLPELRTEAARSPEWGIDLGRWPFSDLDGAAELIANLDCGAVKVGVPMIGAPKNEQETNYLRQIRDLARHLTLRQVETTGVILASGAADPDGGRLSTCRMLVLDQAWASRAGPVLAQFGGHLTSWQLGSEPVELCEPGAWDLPAIAQARRQLERFAAVPQLVVPRSVFDAPPASRLINSGQAEREPGPDSGGPPSGPFPGGSQPRCAYSFWLPAELSARTLPWQLAFWFDSDLEGQRSSSYSDLAGDQTPSERWLSLGLERSGQLPAADRLADMARRVVLASAVNPDRLYVPAPFEHTTGGGRGSWQPTDEYIPLRTLLHHLSGKRAVAAMTLPHNSVAVLFKQSQTHTLVAWTWEQPVGPVEVGLYLGEAAWTVELNGAPQALEFDGPLARVRLAPMPLIIEDVDAPLLLLQDSFRVEPASIQLHEPEPRPVLMLRNYYDAELAGTIDLHLPPAWEVSPNPIRVQLGPGQSLAQTLRFTIPPRQIASEQTLGVDVHLLRPRPVRLHFDPRLLIELNDIVVKAAVWWDGSDLVVEQSLRNLSPQPVSFNAFCQASLRAQLEGVFLNVPPGDVRVQTYRLPAARDLAGTKLWMGIQEIGGRRTLDQLVAVPR
jgi:hypothetical protein